MRSVLLYLVLVGVPVMGVAAILRAGQDLRAPVSFGGAWRLEAWPDSSCHIATHPDTLRLVVEQSGPLLQIRFAKGTALSGRVAGDSFVATGRHRVRMEARRGLVDGAQGFTGVVAGAPCPAARRTRIRATRIQLPSELTGH